MWDTQISRGRRIFQTILAVVLALTLSASTAGSVHADEVRTGRVQAEATAVATVHRIAPINHSRDGVLHAGKLRTDKTVWLTFDDQGSAAQVDAILKTLTAQNVRAVFFPTGSFARANAKLIQRMKAQGHYVGNHTYSHAKLTKLSVAQIKSEIDKAAAYIRPNTTPKLFRCPYGAGSYSPMINKILAARGYQNSFWTVDTLDWDKSSASVLIRRVRDGYRSSNGTWNPPVAARGVVLMHMHGRHTGTALPGIIKAIRGKKLLLPKIR
jgi:peptidoglycan/xylan/chitin deacetylase (PgdA/CDA1 family)